MAPPPTNSPVTDSPGMGSTSAFRARGTTAPSRAPEQAPPAVEPSAPATRPAAATVVTAAAPKTKGKRRRLLFLVPILLVALAVGLTYAYRYWYEATYFVSTDNASVTGDLVQVGSLNAGRIVATRVDIGATVRQGQEIATVAMPQQVGATTAGVAPKVDIVGTTDTLVPVYAPINGIVASRSGFVGGTVAAGQPIYSLVDPNQSWVKANIEEGSAWRIAVGQPVTIHVDALNRDIPGHVEAITPASAATFSLLPSGNVSGNFTKVTQYVPIKIVPDAPGEVLPLGTSVEVRIQVRTTDQSFPLPWRP